MNTAPSVAHLFNETATHTRPELVKDGQGGWAPLDKPMGAVPCRVRSWTSEEEIIARQQGIRISHVCYTDPDVDVKRGDVFVIAGATFDVRSVRSPSIRAHLMVDLEERQTGSGAHPSPLEQDGGEDG